jgi:uncharacterized protein YhdP
MSILFRLLKWLVLAVVLIVAIVLSWLRFGLDSHPLYHQHAAAMIATVLQHPVQLENFQVQLIGWQLDFQLHQVQLAMAADDKQSLLPLVLDTLSLKINILRSLQKRTMVLDRLQISNLQLDLYQQPSGAWTFNPTVMEKTQAGLSNVNQAVLLALLKQQPDLLLTTYALLRLHGSQGTKLVLHNNLINLTQEDGVVVISAQLKFDQHGDSLHIQARLLQDKDNLFSNGHCYVISDGIELTPLAAMLQPNFVVKQLRVGGQLWLHWQNGQITQARGQLDQWQLQYDNYETKANGKFDWQQLSDRWQLQLTNLEASLNGQPVGFTEVAIVVNAQHVIARTAQLELNQTVPVLSMIDELPARIKQPMQGLVPTGQIEQAQLLIARKKPQEFLFSAAMTDVGITAWKSVPEVAHARGHIWLSHRGGKVQLDGFPTNLGFSKLHDQLWKFNYLQGQFTWDYLADRYRFHSSLIQMDTGTGLIYCKLSAESPRRGSDVTPFLQLSLGIRDMNLGSLTDYLPTRIIPASLQEWLIQALPAGQLQQGGIIYNGSFGNRVPANTSALAMTGQLQVPRFNYSSKWPVLRDVSMAFTSGHGQVDLQLQQGNLSPKTKATDASLLLRDLQISVPFKTGVGQFIKVRGQVQGFASQMLKLTHYLNNQTGLPNWVYQLKPQGQLVAEGWVSLPYGHLHDLAYELDLSSHDLSLTLPDQNLTLQKTAGNLSLSSKNGPSLSANIEASELSWHAFKLHQVALSASSLPEQWQLDLSSKELAVKVSQPVSDGPLMMAVDHLHLNMPEKIMDDTLIVDLLEGINPTSIPAANVVIDQISKNGRDLGYWKFKVRPADQQVNLDNLQGVLHHSQWQGKLVWNRQNGKHKTLFTGYMETKNVAKAMQAWGYAPLINSENAILKVNLAWPHSPTGFSLQESSGTLGLDVAQGAFVNVSTFSRSLKVLNLLDMSRIIQHLKLNFADLFQPGLDFNSIKAVYGLEKGVATTQKAVLISSPTLNLSFTGKLDFNQRQVLKQMVVTVPITQQLPLAAWLAGAPQLGGAIYLVNKLIGDELATFTSARYQVEGSLDNPKISLIQIFDKDNVPKTLEQRLRNIFRLD